MIARSIQLANIASPRERASMRLRRMLLALLIAALLVGIVWLQYSGLQRTSYTTGYSLFAAILFLASLQIRKHMPSLPLGKMSTWMQVHIYIGYLAILLFAMHVGPNLPRGRLEIALYAVFIFVAGSGLYGLYITRVVPAKLRALPEEVIYERIPQLRRSVAASAREIVLSKAAESDVLVGIYRQKLLAFFETSRGLFYFLWPSGELRRDLQSQLRDLHRYLNVEQRKHCIELETLVARKDDLDYHAALQGRLKLWLFAHVGFTYSLIVLASVHGILALAFGGSS